MSDLLSAILLVLKVGHFRAPVVNFVQYSVEGHDPLHEQGRDSSSEEANQDIVVHDVGASGVTLEDRDVTFERRGELPILLNHMVGGQPEDSVPGSVLVLKGLLELFEKVIPGSEDNSSAIDGVLLEGVSLSQGRSFSHVQEGEGDFLHIVVVGSLVDCEIELDRMHPRDSRFVGAIEGLGFAELKLGGFDSGGRHRGRDRWAWVWGR